MCRLLLVGHDIKSTNTWTWEIFPLKNQSQPKWTLSQNIIKYCIQFLLPTPAHKREKYGRKTSFTWVWWHASLISRNGRLRQEDWNPEANVVILSLWLKISLQLIIPCGQAIPLLENTKRQNYNNLVILNGLNLCSRTELPFIPLSSALTTQERHLTSGAGRLKKETKAKSKSLISKLFSLSGDRNTEIRKQLMGQPCLFYITSFKSGRRGKCHSRANRKWSG